MHDVEVPKFWSQVATDVLAQKYFRKAGVPQKDKDGNIILDSSGKPVLGLEKSAKQTLHRLAAGWTHWGKVGNYFATEEDGQTFYDELLHMLVNQIASPNSPQWFNTGLNLVYGINGPAQGHYYFDPQTGQLIESKDSYSRPQVHACFIQSIKDDLVNPGGIMDLWMREARIYKYGSGSGTNFSNIRGEGEPLSGGGKSSGVLSFLKIGDVTAGSIKSGGTTRRASKMVILDDDHPEIEKFINWKYNEEKKVAALIAAGYPSDYEGEAYSTVSGQNSNNSVRVSNKFMEAVANDDTWDLKWRTNGKVCKTLKAKDLWNQIGHAAWACADPGLQFDTIINDWHTCPNSGKIRASNPCVTGDTLVTLADGKKVRIDKFVDKPVEILTQLDQTSSSLVRGSFVTGVKDIFKLTTKSGYSINLTADHKVFTSNRGFVPANKLKKGDKIKLEEKTVSLIQKPEDEKFYQLVGLILGDGYLTEDQLFLTMNIEEKNIIEDFVEYVNENFESTSVNELKLNTQFLSNNVARLATNRSSLIQKLNQIELKANVPSNLIEIPEWVFESNLGIQRNVLQGLFTADGTVANYGDKSQYISLDSTSIEMLKDVQILLLNFGIKSKIYKDRRCGKLKSLLPDGKGGVKEYDVKEIHSLRISRNSRLKFEKFIGFVEKSEKNKKLRELNSNIKTYKDFFADEFKSIEYLGKKTVYDITEPLTHSFIANGIVVHNCSEYMFVDDTACNLASLNIMRFFDPDTKTFDVDAFKHAVRLWTIVLEISVFMAQYPSAEIAKRSYEFRTLGLGYTNLGTMLMVSGIPYDSEDARAIAAAISAIMGGESYATSAEIASVIGPFPKYEENKESMLRVIRNHRRAAYNADPKEYEKVEIKPVGINHKICPGYLLNAAISAWDRALELGEKFGYRNAQATLIAPTGTISLQMDCDTTGIEPDFAIVKFKKLAGGGYFKIVNQSVSLALKNLGYAPEEIIDIIKYVAGMNSLRGSPYINEFTLKMKGFTQDDLQKIEKVLPSFFDLKQAFTFWNMGRETIERIGFKPEQYNDPKFDLLKSLGFSDQEIEVANDYICGTMTIEGAPHLKEENYLVFDCANRCGRKGKRIIGYMGHIWMMSAVQPFLSGSISKTINMPNDSTIDDVKNTYLQSWKLGLKSIALYRDGSKLSQPLSTKTADKQEVKLPSRRKLPAERKSITHKFRVGNQEGYLTVGLYEDGTPGEIFVKMAKEGSSLAGMMDSFGLAIAMALQYGTPLKVLVDKFVHTRFEPSGWTDNPQIQVAKSIVDYIFRWLGLKFLPESEHRSLGINGAKTYELSETEKQAKLNVFADDSKKSEGEDENYDDAQVCSDCGSFMVRSGSCYVCTSCGTTSGCS